jgi:sulfatase maturation enzyme AslB (radical SAM superfamily)
LDAGTAETYARLKFGGHRSGATKFEAAVANLTRLAARRRATGSELEISVSFILYPQNHHELYEAARVAREAGADRLRLKRDISGERLLDAASRTAAGKLVQRIRRDLVDDDFQLVEVHKTDEPANLTRTFAQCSITNLMAAVGSDGHLYPCNYHPRPGGASYGSAIDTSFQEVWEGARRMQLRRQLPSICPKVCDPFKNRANNLLQAADHIVAAHGLDHLERNVHALVDAEAYDPRHPGRSD